MSTDDQFYFFKGNQLEYLPLWKPYGSCVLTNRDIKYINNTKIHDPNGRLHYKKLHINRGFKQFYFPSVTRKQLSRFKGDVGSFSTFSWSSTNPTKRQKPTMMILWFVVVSLEHQMCVNPPLKIVPKALFPLVWLTFVKNYSEQLLLNPFIYFFLGETFYRVSCFVSHRDAHRLTDSYPGFGLSQDLMKTTKIQNITSLIL